MTMCGTKENINYWEVSELKPIIDSSLLCWYTADLGTTSLWTDRSINNRNALSANTTRILHKTILGYSVGFNGTSSIMNTTNLPESQSYSLCAWIYTTSTRVDDAEGKRIITIYRNQSMGTKISLLIRNTKLQLYWYDSSNIERNITSTASVNDGIWHFVVGTTNGTTFKLYIDGVQVGTIDSTFTSLTSTVSDAIGMFNMYGGKYDGRISSIRIYNRQLADTEIQSEYTDKYIYAI